MTVEPGQAATPAAPRIASKAERDFRRFDDANPHVYVEIVARARDEVRRSGRRRLGVRGVYDRMRWEAAVKSDAADFKLPENHTPFYARKVMAHEADLRGLFELRGSPPDCLCSACFAGEPTDSPAQLTIEDVLGRDGGGS